MANVMQARAIPTKMTINTPPFEGDKKINVFVSRFKICTSEAIFTNADEEERIQVLGLNHFMNRYVGAKYVANTTKSMINTWAKKKKWREQRAGSLVSRQMLRKGTLKPGLLQLNRMEMIYAMLSSCYLFYSCRRLRVTKNPYGRRSRLAF